VGVTRGERFRDRPTPPGARSRGATPGRAVPCGHGHSPDASASPVGSVRIGRSRRWNRFRSMIETLSSSGCGGAKRRPSRRDDRPMFGVDQWLLDGRRAPKRKPQNESRRRPRDRHPAQRTYPRARSSSSFSWESSMSCRAPRSRSGRRARHSSSSARKPAARSGCWPLKSRRSPGSR